MKITLLCKTCHETEFKLLSEQGLVKFQCINCGEVQNQLKIGKLEVYKNKCTSCYGDIFKVRIDREKKSAHIECKNCKKAPEKIYLEDEVQNITREEIINKEIALTKSEETTTETKIEVSKDINEIMSAMWEMKNDLIRISNRIDELERKERIENAKKEEIKNDSLDIEGIIKKFISRK